MDAETLAGREEFVNERRLRKVRITDRLLLNLLTYGFKPAYTIIENAVPDDARIVDAEFEDNFGTVTLTIQHESFSPVPLMEPVPDHAAPTAYHGALPQEDVCCE